MRELMRRVARWLIGSSAGRRRMRRLPADPGSARVWAPPGLWYDGSSWRRS